MTGYISHARLYSARIYFCSLKQNCNKRFLGTIRSVLSEDTPSPQPDPSMHPAFPQPPNSSTQPNLASSPKVVNRSASIQSQDSIATSTSGLERQSSNGLTTPPVNSSNAPPFLQLPSAASALGSNSKHRPNLNGGFQVRYLYTGQIFCLLLKI